MINAKCLKNAIISGANNICKNKSLVDDLNIFPVPDGDTGTNMSMTMSSAIMELTKSDFDKVCDVSSKAASALLRGARGNSGVILSLLFRGFSKGFKDLEYADGPDLVNALGIGVDSAYGAVMKPTEGTMLTVARVAYEKGKDALNTNTDPIFIWEQICAGANEALKTTPELLPVLKKAGVVDAGGQGVCLIFEGMLSVFRDGIIIENDSINNTPVEEVDEFRSAAAEFDGDINFTYCTEFIIGRNKECSTKPAKLRDYLEKIGDCVVVVDDDEIIKVHVHTEEPGNALQKALSFGQLLTVKVENMKEQHRLAGENKKSKPKEELRPVDPIDEFGFVAVAAGDGIENLFKDLGCTHVVSGGQTMNPSTDDILRAVLATPSKTVYVLPNNKNIVLAAEQAVPLVQDRKVVVIPTKTIPQGISAMLAFDSELSSMENQNLMVNAASSVSTGQITFAARNSEYGGLKIKEGEILALDNGKLVFAEKDPLKAAIRLVKSMANRDTQFITIIHGEGVSKEDAQHVVDVLSHKFGSKADITLIDGGQPIYHFIISIE